MSDTDSITRSDKELNLPFLILFVHMLLPALAPVTSMPFEFRRRTDALRRRLLPRQGGPKHAEDVCAAEHSQAIDQSTQSVLSTLVFFSFARGAYMHNIFHQSERACAASERKKDQIRKYCVL